MLDSPDALRVARLDRVDPGMVAILTEKSGAERLAIAAGMFRAARRMLQSELRCQHPTWADERLTEEVSRRLRGLREDGTG